MERHLKLVLAYDGTEFHGWQRQAGVRTVQDELEQVLRRVLRHPLHVAGASRTDAGVHARGQVAAVQTVTPIPLANLERAIGHRLPDDIGLVSIAEVAPEFHPARSATRKLYRYRIWNSRRRPVVQLAARYAWHVWHPLDLERLRAAARALVGTHDFVAFATPGSPRLTTVRTVERLEVGRAGDEVVFEVAGDGFLYNQVRNMIGTLVEIGRGHWEPERIPLILAGRDRRAAGPTAPPHGLCLEWVQYRDDVRAAGNSAPAGGADGTG
jgi:tRNA pseudouridine38-40 synthase